MHLSRRHVVSGIALTTIAPALPPRKIPAPFAAVAEALRDSISTVQRSTINLARACDGLLSQKHAFWLVYIRTCALDFPNVENPEHYRPDQLRRFRHQLTWPLNGLCGFAELLGESATDLPHIGRQSCRTIQKTGLDIAWNHIPALYALETRRA